MKWSLGKAGEVIGDLGQEWRKDKFIFICIYIYSLRNRAFWVPFCCSWKWNRNGFIRKCLRKTLVLWRWLSGGWKTCPFLWRLKSNALFARSKPIISLARVGKDVKVPIFAKQWKTLEKPFSSMLSKLREIDGYFTSRWIKKNLVLFFFEKCSLWARIFS